MPRSNSTSTSLVRTLSPSEQLAIATHLQALRRQEDNLRALAATWPAHQRRQFFRCIKHQRRVRFSIWAVLDISTEVLP